MKKKGFVKLQAREIVLLAVMTAICVAANTICSHTVPLHAGTAFVVISGISLGPGPACLIGVLGRFICNFFDGQGPWTIWQMASWGLIGCISGICFKPVHRESLLERQRKKKQTLLEVLVHAKDGLYIFLCVLCSLGIGVLEAYINENSVKAIIGWRMYVYAFLGVVIGSMTKQKKLPANRMVMAIYTLLITFTVYGGIMNIATLVLQHIANEEQNPMNLETLALLYVTGVPYDLGHAAGAAVCIFLVGESLLQKLERIRVKYSIFKNQTHRKHV